MDWKITTAVPISDILPHEGDSIKVVVAKTGKVAYLPKRCTEIRPGHAIVPKRIARRVLGGNI